jgi:hypothetical protein
MNSSASFIVAIATKSSASSTPLIQKFYYAAMPILSFLALVVTLVITLKTLKSQRQMAQDDRVWDKRAEAYVDLADWAWKGANYDGESMDVVFSKALAFASDEVLSMVIRILSIRAPILRKQAVHQQMNGH